MIWFFGFHSPARHSLWARLGHVEAWACTIDETWVFFDPRMKGTRMFITHLHDEVMDALTLRHAACDEILRYHGADEFTVPNVLPMTCATQCGALVGIRAWTPWGLKRKLLAKGAESVT